MHYTISSLFGGEPVDTLEAHVLARAYRAAWEAKNRSAPVGPHPIAGLDLVIDFGSAAQSPLPGRAVGAPSHA